MKHTSQLLDLRPLRSVLVDLATARQADWTRFLARSGLDDSASLTLAETIRVIADFVDPIIADELSTGVWNPAKRRWQGYDRPEVERWSPQILVERPAAQQ